MRHKHLNSNNTNRQQQQEQQTQKQQKQQESTLSKDRQPTRLETRRPLDWVHLPRPKGKQLRQLLCRRCPPAWIESVEPLKLSFAHSVCEHFTISVRAECGRTEQWHH